MKYARIFGKLGLRNKKHKQTLIRNSWNCFEIGKRLPNKTFKIAT